MVVMWLLTVVVAVSVCDDGEAAPHVPRPEHRPQRHPVLDVPEGEPVPEEVPGGARHLEAQLHLPVPGSARNLNTSCHNSLLILSYMFWYHLVPYRPLLGSVIACQSNVVACDHSGANEIPVGNPETVAWTNLTSDLDKYMYIFINSNCLPVKGLIKECSRFRKSLGFHSAKTKDERRKVKNQGLKYCWLII